MIAMRPKGNRFADHSRIVSAIWSTTTVESVRIVDEMGKHAGRYETPLGMLPSQQRLESFERRCTQIDDRLVVWLELAGIDSAQHLALEKLVSARLVLHGRREAGEARAPCLLRAPERQVRLAEKAADVAAVLRKRGNTHRDGDPHAAAADDNVVAKRLGDRRGDRSERLGIVEVGEQHGEFVAAKAGDPGATPVTADDLAQPFADEGDHAVAELVSEGVVDVLEVVHIHEYERMAAAGRTLREQIGKMAEEGRPVREPRQGVVRRVVAHALQQRPLVRDVLQRDDEARRPSAGIRLGLRDRPQPAAAAIAGGNRVFDPQLAARKDELFHPSRQFHAPFGVAETDRVRERRAKG